MVKSLTFKSFQWPGPTGVYEAPLALSNFASSIFKFSNVHPCMLVSTFNGTLFD